MSAYELQVLETGRQHDSMMREIDKHDSNILSSVVPGSRLHEIIHDPITEGIDEG